MVGNQPYDDYGDFGSDDLGPGADEVEVSYLDAFDAPYAFSDPDPSPLDEPADQPAEPMFTVTNPPGTVTVSALTDGSVHWIGLSPKATDSTEDLLAAEIVVIADLATQQARSAQFTYMLEGLQSNGHDASDTRDFLTRSVGLPSPEQADAARAQIFATRYAGEHD